MSSTQARIWRADQQLFPGLPTIDPDSLLILSLLEILPQEQVEIVVGTSDFIALPYLHQQDAQRQSTGALKNDLLKQCLKTSQGDAAMNADILAFCALCENDLTNVVLYSFFAIPLNWTRVTRPAYCQKLPFPSSVTTSAQLYNRAKKRLLEADLWGAWEELEEIDRLKQNDLGLNADSFKREQRNAKERQISIKARYEELKVISVARRIFGDLRDRLRDGQYFSNLAIPGPLDVVVYSRLAILLQAKLEQPSIANLCRDDFPNLVRHMQRVHSHLFPNSPAYQHQNIAVNSLRSVFYSLTTLPDTFFFSTDISKRTESAKEKDFARKRFWYLSSVLSVAVAFSYWQGLVKFPESLAPAVLDRAVEEEE